LATGDRPEHRRDPADVLPTEPGSTTAG